MKKVNLTAVVAGVAMVSLGGFWLMTSPMIPPQITLMDILTGVGLVGLGVKGGSGD